MKEIKAVLAFGAVCFMGLVTGLAGGAEWGTVAAGWWTGAVSVAASAAFALVVFLPDNK